MHQPYSKTERIDLVICVRIVHILVLNILIRFLYLEAQEVNWIKDKNHQLKK